MYITMIIYVCLPRVILGVFRISFKGALKGFSLKADPLTPPCGAVPVVLLGFLVSLLRCLQLVMASKNTSLLSKPTAYVVLAPACSQPEAVVVPVSSHAVRVNYLRLPIPAALNGCCARSTRGHEGSAERGHT